MFKKLRQKIVEEQTQPRSPGGRAPQQPQTHSKSSQPSPGNRSRTSSITEQPDEGTLTPDRELLAGMIAEPAFLSEYTIFALDPKQPKPQSDSVNVSKQTTPKSTDSNGSEPPSPQLSDIQTFAQKLQLRVPSMESLFRSPVKESLFRSSSKESLVRTSSRESLNRLDFDTPGPTFDPPSDVESEAEESLGNMDSLSKEQLLQRLRRMERSLGNYRGKYSELVTAYQTVQREKKKLQGILSQSQDKALRRIGELREELQMDQQAKKHLQEEFDASLEEKDQLISVLQTQVSLLKRRLQNGQISTELPETNTETEPQVQSPAKEISAENVLEPGGTEGDGDSAKALETLIKRVKRQENLLQRCKEMIRSHKERSAQLTNEKEALQEQLEERLQELEKMKELHMAEKTKLITQLRDAKNLIEQLEQDKGMVIAETKRQMHETMEMKEEEIVQLRAHIKQITTQGEDLREQKEKSEKAAFEELEKALSTAQKVEEARKKLQAEMDEKIKAIEKTSEEERVNLQQELTRVKQEVVEIMKKSSEERVAELEKLHKRDLATKEQELNERLQAQEKEFQEKMRAALEKSQSECLQTVQEKEQQESLALEELELQKKAIQSECEKKLQDMQQEIQTSRTRILELESSLAKYSQEDKRQLEELTTLIESEKNKHNKEITVMVEKHREELENMKQQEEELWKEKLQILKQQQQSTIEKLREKHEQEMDIMLKEKESVFRAHIEEMNAKTLEKLDVKQTELEALSFELSETLKIRHDLEQEHFVLKDDVDKTKQESEAKLRNLYQEKIDMMVKEHDISVQGIKKANTEETNQLKVQLEEKEKHLEELKAQEHKLKESLEISEAELNQVSAKLGDLCQSHQNNSSEQAKVYEGQLTELQQKLINMEDEKSHLKEQIVRAESQLNEVRTELDSYISQVHDLRQQLEDQRSENTQKITSLKQQYDSQLKDLGTEIDQAKRDLVEKENQLEQLKKQQNQQVEELKQMISAKEERISALQVEYENSFKQQGTKMEKIKQKAKEMQETFQKKLSEQEAKLKKEFENKQLEFSQKEKHFSAKMLEMAHASSVGINDAVSKLEMNQKEQLESLAEAHRQELEEVAQTWRKKLNQQVEELKEKHETELHKKQKEVGDMKQKLATFSAEKEGTNIEITRLKEEQVKRDESWNELQEQLKQLLAQVNTLSQSETDLKAQLEKLEDDLSHSLKDRAVLQEQLREQKTVEEKHKIKVTELTGMLKTSDEKLQILESSYCKEREDYEKKLEDKHFASQQKQIEFERLSSELAAQLDIYWKEADTLLQTKTNEVIEKCTEKINLVISRIAHCQHQTTKIKKAILIKNCKIPELETQLRQITERHTTVNSSLQESTQQLQDKENVIILMKADIERLVTEKELLQKEGGHQQQAATEKETCITQLRKELSENINVVTSMREELKEKESEICALNKLVNELNVKLENSVGLTEKEAAISLLSKQHQEDQLQLLNQVQELSSRVELLSQEKASALEQVDHWMNKLSEWKKKAQLRFTQNHNTIKELQSKLELNNIQIGGKDEEISQLKEELDKQSRNLDGLKAVMEQKQKRREKQEIELTAELKIQTARIAELEEYIAQKTAENDSLMEELKRHTERRDTEQKELVQQLQQAEVVVVEKDNRFKEAEEKVLSLEKQMDSMKAELDTKQREFEQMKTAMMKSKEEELKMLEDRMNAENTIKLADLKKKAEQKIASVKKQLTSQMEEKEQQLKVAMLQDLEQKMQEREAKIMDLEEKNRLIRDSADLEKEMIQKMENVKASLEQEKASMLENVRQMYEEKINVIQKDLTDKDGLLQKYENEQQESNDSKLKMKSQQEELFKKLECTEKKLQEEQSVIKRLQKEIEEKNKQYSLLLDQHTQDGDDLASIREELKAQVQKHHDMENVIGNLQKQLHEKDKVSQSLERKIRELEDDIIKNKEAWKVEMEEVTFKYEEKLQGLQQQLDERNSQLKVFEENAKEETKSDLELQKLLGDMQTQQKDLQAKLEETDREKQKLRKEISKVQKDLRTLRKEHKQELDIMKKESLEEMEQKIRIEQEDIELKHNSTLKQLMREFNTQLAQKERELETAVHETISKAQDVETELIETHHAETTQLHRKIAEKDDDLKRTVKKYEEILEAREEEMTAKVNELQTQLEELQKKYKQKLADEENRHREELTITELQIQLAQKTTLVNDSKLKEQEFMEQIHILKDRLKNYEKNVYVTAVGSPYRDGNLCHADVSAFGEPTEFEYLRKVLFEYMMGRETKTMAKVITTVLKFPADQTQKILEREDARPLFTSPRSGIF
ncbi:LOW QUALITY PROTEIN: golgin subfamily A member 4 [Dermochelys coriacea]|uniref:LOW QUALITY PROTEIN: golgin subfamily A member 4 n=1 Tax=Dermochelys coriacea TaxID=27794 RepID=UPI001CA87EC5|nr:LOW QUALITY PROTEIN: golgin subfamily A member 4 [Dermochelys coriacea]